MGTISFPSGTLREWVVWIVIGTSTVKKLAGSTRICTGHWKFKKFQSSAVSLWLLKLFYIVKLYYGFKLFDFKKVKQNETVKLGSWQYQNQMY